MRVKRTGVRCGHRGGDGGAEGHGEEGEEGEDVWSVHFLVCFCWEGREGGRVVD